MNRAHSITLMAVAVSCSCAYPNFFPRPPPPDCVGVCGLAGDGAQACVVLAERGERSVAALAPLLPGLCGKIAGWRLYVPPGLDAGSYPAEYIDDQGGTRVGRVAGQTYCALHGITLADPAALTHELIHAYQCPREEGHAFWADAGYYRAIEGAE